ncbi:VPA1262 family N-terminal domain-containing protein [Azospirillum argentinense]|nr:VPA1262 family N-terminal domain-containing protein [Azospirillum argentinense]
MIEIVPRNQSSNLIDDYRHALIHLAWYRENRQRFLLFAMVELFPAELPLPDPTEEQTFAVRSLGRQHSVYLRRIPMTVQDALEWHKRALQGTVLVPDDTPTPVDLANSGFAQEPVWPYLLATRTLPFLPWTSVRAHLAVQRVLPPEARRPLQDPRAVGWLSDRLHFDVLKHSEWMGSVSLVAPNPVLREVAHTLGVADDEEFSDFRFVVRNGQTLDGLTLHLTEHRPNGIVAHRALTIRRPYMRVAHIGRTERVGFILACSSRGVLAWHEPTPFIRSATLEVNVIEAEKEVSIPATHKQSAERYRTRMVSGGGHSTLGEPDTEPHVTTVLRTAEIMRAHQEQVAQSGQRLFHGDQAEATKYVRALIEAARHRVIIVDPYFAARELLSFALATSWQGVDVTVLTSAEVLQASDDTAPAQEKGEVLSDTLKAIGKQAKIRVLVMTGSPPLVHDRFLVIDQSVWLSGNSLNEIGKRAGVIVKLPDAESIIRFLDGIMASKDRVKSLEDWKAGRAAARAATDETIGEAK